MKFSYNWLQTYFDEKLPPPEKLAELFSFHFSEVESVEQARKDTVFDLKILPDRAHYALSHRGVAREVSAMVGLKIREPKDSSVVPTSSRSLGIRIEDPGLCRRYIGVMVEDVKIGSADTKTKERLEILGQRSINNVVDAANYVMFDLGQPLHAFDADKVKGAISVRKAKKGESLETLDGKKLSLDVDTLVIADEEGPLAIAGIKGGKRAEVGEKTTRLILESANFDPVSIRRTSAKLQLRTDASKRFENEITAKLAGEAMRSFLDHVLGQKGATAKITSYRDEYPREPISKTINISLARIEEVLGEKIGSKRVEEIFNRLLISFVKNGNEYSISPPAERLDLIIPEDIIEEVGRSYGYENIPATLPRKNQAQPGVMKSLYWQDRIRDFLAAEGFSEIYTYSFRHEGKAEVLKSLASDKNFLRENLTKNMLEALQQNMNNAPILGLSRIKIYEIGKVYPKANEALHLCVGVAKPKGDKGLGANDAIRGVRDRLVVFLGAPIATICTIDDTGGVILLSGKQIGTINAYDGIMEIDLDKLMEVLPAPHAWDKNDLKSEGAYRPISQYPFIVRDVAVYVGSENTFEDILKIVRVLAADKKLPNLAIVPKRPFDEFLNSKLNKKSFAFRLVFQSGERTLTDPEVNAEMEHVYSALKAHKDWQIR